MFDAHSVSAGIVCAVAAPICTVMTVSFQCLNKEENPDVCCCCKQVILWGVAGSAINALVYVSHGASASIDWCFNLTVLSLVFLVAGSVTFTFAYRSVSVVLNDDLLLCQSLNNLSLRCLGLSQQTQPVW